MMQHLRDVWVACSELSLERRPRTVLQVGKMVGISAFYAYELLMRLHEAGYIELVGGERGGIKVLVPLLNGRRPDAP